MLHAPVHESKKRKSSSPALSSRESRREFHPPLGSQWNNLHSTYGNQAVLRMMSGQPARAQAENGNSGSPPSSGPTPVGGGGAGGGTSATMPTATLEEFRASGNTASDNCCALCPESLGVGRGGTASNGMEMRFRINGHRAGVGYDILRTRATSLWETGHAGTTGWTQLETEPMGTNDDHTNDDECLIPNKSKIYVMDRPGFNSAVPMGAGTIFQGVGGATTHGGATEVVEKFNFAEWVSAKDFSAGGNWQVISNPTFTFWHAIVWLTKGSDGKWNLDTARSEIATGSILSEIGRAP